MAYGDIIEYEGRQYRDITPNLTSNTTPAPYYANASGEYIYNAQTGKGRAFGVFIEPPLGWSPGNPPNWIGLGMGQPVQVDLIRIGNRALQKITLYCSDDNGATLKDISSFTSDTLTDTPTGEIGYYYCRLPQGTKHSYYRLHTTSISPSGWSGFKSIRFYQALSDRYLIADNGRLKTIKDNTLTTLDAAEPTQALFEQEGFTNLMDIGAVAIQLYNRFEVLRYHPDSANTAVTINHLPAEQLIMPVADINVSAYSSIKQITLTTTGSTGVAKVIFSFDGGASWRTYADGAWAAIEPTAHAVAASGVTAADVAAIPTEAWTAVTGPLRVAYCLAKSAITDDLAVAQLTITGNTSSWDKARHMTDYDYEYPSTATLLVKLLADGSYKINRMNGGER